MTDQTPPAVPQEPLAPIALRGAVGGVLMGLANLVPGISGGTMLLAVGIYPRFIEAIGDVTTLKLRKTAIVTLACVIGAAVVAIGLLAGVVKQLVVDHRWIMYAIFIGLTLGGVPVVWRLIGAKKTPGMWIGAVLGFVAMGVLALFQMQGGGGGDNSGWVFLFIAGIAGASAMILPGVSGGYLLLVLGVYVPILAGISAFKDALKAGDVSALTQIGVSVILPVGLGVVIGVVAVSNALKWLLHRYEKPTLGFLLGLLIGAVVGLWPFQQGVPPQPGDAMKGQTVAVDDHGELYLAETGKPVEPDDYPTAFFTPSASQVGIVLVLITGGIGATLLVDRLGREKKKAVAATSE